MLGSGARNNSKMVDADYVYKIIVLGDAGVGKSSLLRRIHDNTFENRLPTTVGVDFFIQDLKINGKNVKVSCDRS